MSTAALKAQMLREIQGPGPFSAKAQLQAMKHSVEPPPVTFTQCFDATRADGEKASDFSTKLCSCTEVVLVATRAGRILTGPEVAACEELLGEMKEIIDRSEGDTLRQRIHFTFVKSQVDILRTTEFEEAAMAAQVAEQEDMLGSLTSSEQLVWQKMEQVRFMNCMMVAMLGTDKQLFLDSPLMQGASKAVLYMQEHAAKFVALEVDIRKRFQVTPEELSAIMMERIKRLAVKMQGVLDANRVDLRRYPGIAQMMSIGEQIKVLKAEQADPLAMQAAVTDALKQTAFNNETGLITKIVDQQEAIAQAAEKQLKDQAARDGNRNGV